jgi:methylated-DNA-protein-cysteine methyltransferase-like protein
VSKFEQFYRLVERVPEGRVATYGQIAMLAGQARQARQVGYALAALRSDDLGLPWHRIVNAEEMISMRANAGSDDLQRVLLESEGVEFDALGRIDLVRFLWEPDR